MLKFNNSHQDPDPSRPGHPKPTRPTRLENSHLPISNAMMNDRVNHMEPEQYPPTPTLSRNETPPYRRLTGMDYKKSILKVES